jgi:2-polyprenyl-6-methoxyphenol hydroxylase-like FAD-dependent oxidoreductase
MKALIAGAGIGGLATAIALRQAGLVVEVLERSQELRESGAGLMIWPNGTRSLQALNVAVRRLVVERISFRSWRGHELTEIPMDIISKRYGADVAFVSRADLQTALMSALSEGALSLGADVQSFEETEDHVEVRSIVGKASTGSVLAPNSSRSIFPMIGSIGQL